MKTTDVIHILTFHGLGSPERELEKGEDRYWLDVSFLEAILDQIKELPDVRLTFDDSNSSDCKIALPALVKRRLSASFFVVSKRIGSPGFLTAEQTRELARAGMEIGSHGTRHRRWAELNASDLHEELSASRDELETVLGREVRKAACPFGSYNRRVLRGLRSAGYTRVYTSDQGPARRNEWVSARNTIVRSHTLRYVQNIIESKPRGAAAFLRMLKLTVKRWR